MNVTYKYRLLTKKCDHQRLVVLLESQRQLYNAALAERRYAYKMVGRYVSYYDQCRELTECRSAFSDMRDVPAQLQRGTLYRLDKAFKGFFRRVKAGQKPGFPRFKGRGRFHALEWAEFQGITFDGKKIKSKAFGSIRVHLHRPLPDEYEIKDVKIVKDVKGWYVCFRACVSAVEKRNVNSSIGVDVGLESLATLSTGEKIPSLRASRKAERKLRIVNRALSRAQRGSNRRKKTKIRLQRVHAKIKNTRQTYLHQVSAKLIKEHDLIAVEKLSINNMMKNRHLSKSVADASWSTLKQMLSYKAEKAGKIFIEVDPRYTSQDCSGCGFRVKKKLSERLHICVSCGLILDRDENAARNILNKAVLSLEEPNVEGRFKRVPANIIGGA